jgi:hypothetical protein
MLLQTGPHSVLTQKNIIRISTAMKTLNLTQIVYRDIYYTSSYHEMCNRTNLKPVQDTISP